MQLGLASHNHRSRILKSSRDSERDLLYQGSQLLLQRLLLFLELTHRTELQSAFAMSELLAGSALPVRRVPESLVVLLNFSVSESLGGRLLVNPEKLDFENLVVLEPLDFLFGGARFTSALLGLAALRKCPRSTPLLIVLEPAVLLASVLVLLNSPSPLLLYLFPLLFKNCPVVLYQLSYQLVCSHRLVLTLQTIQLVNKPPFLRHFNCQISTSQATQQLINCLPFFSTHWTQSTECLDQTHKSSFFQEAVELMGTVGQLTSNQDKLWDFSMRNFGLECFHIALRNGGLLHQQIHYYQCTISVTVYHRPFCTEISYFCASRTLELLEHHFTINEPPLLLESAAQLPVSVLSLFTSSAIDLFDGEAGPPLTPRHRASAEEGLKFPFAKVHQQLLSLFNLEISMKFNSATNLNRRTIQIKSDPRYWHLRSLLSAKLNKENRSPNHLHQEFHKVKHKFQDLFKEDKQRKNQSEMQSSQHKFYRTKWTQILLKNYTLLTQRKAQELFVFGWSSLYNFLFLARDQLLQAEVRLTSDHFLCEQLDKQQIRQLLQLECEDQQLQRICKGTVPESLRGQVYLRYFSSSLQEEQFNQLMLKTQEQNKLLSEVVKEDVERVCESQQFFVFKQDITLLIKVFLLDTKLLQDSPIVPYKLQERKLFPSGIIPHKLIARLICPFFFLSLEKQIVYLLFRQFFVKYFIRLVAIHPKADCIPALIAKFRIQFQTCLPDLHKKLQSKEIKACKMAFEWIFHCFIGFLQIQEVLKVFDLIIGHDSLEILVSISLGMFGLKRRRLMIAERGQFQEILRFEGVTVRDCLQEWENLKIDIY